MQYEKLTVERFAERLANKEYKDLTGARRAIGKTSSWSAKEKERAHALANAHFGGAPTPAPTVKAPAAKTAKKAAAKKPVHVAKAPAPVAPKVAVKAPVQKTAAAKAAPKAAAKKTPPKKPVEDLADGERQASSQGDDLYYAQNTISAASAAMDVASKIRNFSPDFDFTELNKEVSQVTIGAVRLLGERTASAAGVKDPPAAPPRVSVPRVEPPKPVLSVATEVPTPVNGHPVMTDDERRAAEQFRNAVPASTIADLPRPTS